jgi:hypothetical protein
VPTESATSGRRTVRVRCTSCGTVVATSHPFEHVDCACGRLTVSGRPWDPTIHWTAAAGAGWERLAEPVGDERDGAQDDGAGHEGAGCEGSERDDVPAAGVGARRPIGY